MSNSDPLVCRYIIHRIDRSTETGNIVTIRSYLMSQYGFSKDPIDYVCYGPCITNKLERWWRDLHERLEKYFKSPLKEFLYKQEYDPHNNFHRQMLAYVYVPVLQRECGIFVNTLNSHRIRNQKDCELSTGGPNHLFSFLERYGTERMGIAVFQLIKMHLQKMVHFRCLNNIFLVLQKLRVKMLKSVMLH